MESCGDRCMGSERRVRIGEEIGRRQSARLVRQTPALFHNEAEGSRWSVHGDDFPCCWRQAITRPAGTDTALKVIHAEVPPFGSGTLAESHRLSAKIKTGSAPTRSNRTHGIWDSFCATWSSMESQRNRCAHMDSS